MAPNTLTKYDLEKFDGSNDFSLWRMKMCAVLIQQRLLKVLKGKQGLPDTMSANEKEDMLERAHSAITDHAGSQSKAKKLKCYYCHKEGHYRKDCPEHKGEKKDNSKTVDGGVVEDNSDGTDVLLVTINSSDGEWILDTGCSYHMHVPELRKNLISLGTLDSNGCSIWQQRLADGFHIYLLLYVDDMLIAAKSMSDVNSLKEQLKREFEMKDLGVTKTILGMEIQRDRHEGILYLSQKNYINWKATLQTIVALFTTEAEYIATTKAVKEAIWLKVLVGDLGLKQESSTVDCDSQSAIHLTKNQMLHEQTKHIDARYHFIRDVVFQRIVMVEKISTNENSADMMAKHIPEIKFKHCLYLISISSI
ncbi:hypothetical protein RJ639_021401 [Escallonia herrerae]|uniref:CCHC-type domain-containing protein n=1 Tax=Escallonia herrerae TaxID=1293975 RepID=A0AA88V5S9_9ASTE|nr:hypothetical protein RJ639_021401 [Escallonia herrerae]